MSIGIAILGLIVFGLGTSIGSFVNVSSHRVPSGKSIVRPRSYCDACLRPLRILENVPILSYLWLRGRCSTCNAQIPTRNIVTEGLNGAVFVLVYLKYGLGVEFFVLGSAVTLLLTVAVIDLEHKLIPYKIIFPAIAILIIMSPFWGHLGFTRNFLGSSDMLASLANCMTAGAVAFLFLLAVHVAYPPGMGGGDPWLAGVVGLLVGLPGVIVAVSGAIVGGGIVAIGMLALRLKGRKDRIPFAPFLASAGIATLLWEPEIMSAYNNLVDHLMRL